MAWTVSLVGFFVGFLVGLTGIGAAALMTPFLILVGGLRPVVAVGTDLVYGAVTKALGAFVHHRQRTVDLTIAWYLGLGSVPAALLGVGLIRWIKSSGEGATVDHFISSALGLILILVAATLLARPWFTQRAAERVLSGYSTRRKALTVFAGAAIGLMVGLTSVGSGSLVAASLVVLYPELPPRRIVGSDIFHGMVLTAAAGLAHVSLGTVDPALLGVLLVGSLPGVWLGSRLTVRLPDRLLRPVLATVLLGIGYKLL